MEPLVMLFVSALTGGENSPGDPRKVHIIVPRPRAYLADLLAKALEGRGDVEGIVDRRQRARRTQQKGAATERRRMERRRPQEEAAEGVLRRSRTSADGPEGQSRSFPRTAAS